MLLCASVCCVNRQVYNDVLALSQSIVEASGVSDQKAHWSAYNALRELCLRLEGGEMDHPLQWEALADFTTGDEQAIPIYGKALELASLLQLPEYEASILLAMAERLRDMGEIIESRERVARAEQIAANLDDVELRREISEFRVSVQVGT